MTAYLLDTNIFIQAKNLHYGFDFCPAFWDWLIVQNRRRRVASVEKVADELLVGKDDLAAWAKERGSGFFLKPDGGVVDALRTVSMWANGGGYLPAAVSAFLGLADCWLVAHALAHGNIVVTHEVAAGSVRKFKIPGNCPGCWALERLRLGFVQAYRISPMKLSGEPVRVLRTLRPCF